jgi:hypothetical protein
MRRRAALDNKKNRPEGRSVTFANASHYLVMTSGPISVVGSQVDTAGT